MSVAKMIQSRVGGFLVLFKGLFRTFPPTFFLTQNLILLKSKRKKVSGCCGKNDPIKGGRFHCVVEKFADSPEFLPNGLVGLWRTNFVKNSIFD